MFILFHNQMSPQILTEYLFSTKDCVTLCKHKGEEETVPALKELQSSGKQGQGNKQSQ